MTLTDANRVLRLITERWERPEHTRAELEFLVDDEEDVFRLRGHAFDERHVRETWRAYATSIDPRMLRLSDKRAVVDAVAQAARLVWLMLFPPPRPKAWRLFSRTEVRRVRCAA
ncbi:MAG TPA: hypothetical protein VEA38_15100 [Terriglobales bacterium]|nr:hypothetical protein [Terriglobales bacterium]